MAIHHAPSPLLEIADFQPSDASAFRALNHAWIQQYFRLEASDHKALDLPNRIHHSAWRCDFDGALQRRSCRHLCLDQGE